jgi:hypothetical protein
MTESFKGIEVHRARNKAENEVQFAFIGWNPSPPEIPV